MPTYLRELNASTFPSGPTVAARALPPALSSGRETNSAELGADARRQEWQRLVESLGDSERFVLQMILIGMRDREISLQQGVSAGVIAARRRRLVKKLGVNRVCRSAAFRSEV